MQTSTVKNLTTGPDQYAIIADARYIIGPRTAFESGADKTVIVGTLAEIQAEAAARGIPWPAPPPPLSSPTVPVPAGLVSRLNASGAVDVPSLPANVQQQIADVLASPPVEPVPVSLIQSLAKPGVVDLTNPNLSAEDVAALTAIAGSVGA